jgi:membrane protein DedA with SNARE-associated domain
MGFLKFILAAAVGRTLRYSMWGVLAVLYGNPVKQFVQENLRSLGMVLLGILALAIGTVIVTYLLRVRRSNRSSKGA